MKSAIFFYQSNWRNEATATFHNKPRNQWVNITAKIKIGKRDEIGLLNSSSKSKATAKPNSPQHTTIYSGLSAAFLWHHLSSKSQLLVWFSSCSSTVLNPHKCSTAVSAKRMLIMPPREQWQLLYHQGLCSRAGVADYQINVPWNKTKAKESTVFTSVRREKFLTCIIQGLASAHERPAFCSQHSDSHCPVLFPATRLSTSPLGHPAASLGQLLPLFCPKGMQAEVRLRREDEAMSKLSACDRAWRE